MRTASGYGSGLVTWAPSHTLRNPGFCASAPNDFITLVVKPLRMSTLGTDPKRRLRSAALTPAALAVMSPAARDDVIFWVLDVVMKSRRTVLWSAPVLLETLLARLNSERTSSASNRLSWSFEVTSFRKILLASFLSI